MTEPPAPQRIAVVWSPEARADLRAIARDAAMQILHCLDRYLANRTGDVKKLKSPLTGFRLRCGDRCSSISETSRPSTSQPSSTAAKPTADRAVVLSHSSITIFPSWKHDRSGEGGESRPRPLRVHRSEAQSLDSTPALRTLPEERMGSLLPSRCFSRWLFRHLAALLTLSPRRVEASSWERTWNVGRLPIPTSLF